MYLQHELDLDGTTREYVDVGAAAEAASRGGEDPATGIATGLTASEARLVMLQLNASSRAGGQSSRRPVGAAVS